MIMKIKTARLRSTAVLVGCLLLAAVGGTILYRVHSTGGRAASTPALASSLSAKVVVPHYRLSSNQAVKTAAPVWQKPLRNDGTPAKVRKGFAALAKTYNLSLTPTYEGSNQATHPKLLYFPNGWNGYRYWMSITPYPATIDKYENPCIVTSNDLKTWVVPKGLKNPVTGIPADVKYGGHYSDSELVMNGGVMELWYRVDVGNKKTHLPDYKSDYYYRMVSTDGIHWSKPQMMQSSTSSILSLAIVRQQNRYQFWFTNRSHQLMYAKSTNGTKWTDLRPCKIPLPKGYVPWHQDVVFCNNKYYLLQTGWYTPKYSFALFLSESTDGVHFTSGTSFYPSNNSTILHKTWLYRSTFVPVEKGMFQMVVSYRLPGNKWYMTQCSLSEKAWDDACLTNHKVILNQPAAVSRKKAPAAAKKSASSAPRSGRSSSGRVAPRVL